MFYTNHLPRAHAQPTLQGPNSFQPFPPPPPPTSPTPPHPLIYVITISDGPHHPLLNRSFGELDNVSI